MSSVTKPKVNPFSFRTEIIQKKLIESTQAKAIKAAKRLYNRDFEVPEVVMTRSADTLSSCIPTYEIQVGSPHKVLRSIRCEYSVYFGAIITEQELQQMVLLNMTQYVFSVMFCNDKKVKHEGPEWRKIAMELGCIVDEAYCPPSLFRILEQK
jgi:hypothetical protein